MYFHLNAFSNEEVVDPNCMFINKKELFPYLIQIKKICKKQNYKVTRVVPTDSVSSARNTER